MVPEYVGLPTGRRQGSVHCSAAPTNNAIGEEEVVPGCVGLPAGHWQGGVQRPLLTTL